MQYIYKFYNKNDECLYVGKTNRLSSRFSQHKRDKLWFKEIEYIMTAQCLKEFMIDMYELYYINTLSPKHNRKDINIKHVDFYHEELIFKKYKNFKKEDNQMKTIIGKAQLPFSETQAKNVTIVELKTEEKIKDGVSHHILLADCSGSMSSNLSKLKTQIKSVMETLLQIPNSYVSVITYSGHKESKRILSAIKCDDMTYKMNDVYSILDKEIYIKGVTVMSEPLEMSIDICKSLVGICDKNHIALFTDGCLVPWDWSTSEEEKKCFAVAEICKKENIFLNAIGFGQYYDRRFLTKLIEVAGNGDVLHIDNINSYYDVIINTIRKIDDIELIATKVVVSSMCLDLKTGNIGTELTLYGVENFIAIIDNGSSEVYINDELLDLQTSKTIPQDYINDYYYAISKYHLSEEDIDSYEYIIKNLGDVNLYSKTSNCYSFIEKGNALNLVNSMLQDKSLRFEKGYQVFKLDDINEPLCALEILSKIILDENSQIYWDLNTPYNRITQKTNTVEDNIAFKRQESGLIPVYDLSIGSEKLNIGIKVGIPGVVSDSISRLSADAKIFRDYNVINGGNINVPYLNAKLSPALVQELSEMGIIEKNVQFSFVGGIEIYKINLVGIKSANKRLLKSMKLSEIKTTLKRIAELKCEQWAVNKRIKEIVGDNDKLDFATNLSFEEIEIRKALRIDEKGIYQPLAVEKDTESKFDVYPAIFLTWDIKYSEKKGKDACWAIVETETDLIGLKSRLEAVRKEKRELDTKVNTVRIASGVINKSAMLFDTELEKEKTVTDKILGINTVVNGRIKEFKKVVDEDIITQQKWLQMIKCN